MQVGGAAAATNQLNLNARVLLEPKTRDARDGTQQDVGSCTVFRDT